MDVRETYTCKKEMVAMKFENVKNVERLFPDNTRMECSERWNPVSSEGDGSI